MTLIVDSPRFVQALDDVLRQGHSARFRATGWSMHPAIRNGETITVEPLGESPPRVGDVLLYRQGSGAIAHRVVRVEASAVRPTQLVLRGDAADDCDAPIAIDLVLGRVVEAGPVARPVWRGPIGRAWLRASARARRRARDVRQIAAALRAAVLKSVRIARSSGAQT